MFNKIVLVDPVFITANGKEELKKFCKKLIVYDTFHTTEDEAIERIGDAECVVVSYQTSLTQNVLKHCDNLKFVHMCCSFYGKEYTKVDVEYLENNNIEYAFLHGYGDNGAVEFTLAQIMNLLHGFGDKKWKEESYDLTGVKVGILGMGELGAKIAEVLNSLGTTVYYYSRTRKKSLENHMLIYAELDDLLKTVDILSINLNRDVCLIGGDKLDIFGNGKIIVNTALGYCYEKATLVKWLENKSNYYVCDKSSTNEDLKDILGYENVVYTDQTIGASFQAYERATVQIINNIKSYLE